MEKPKTSFDATTKTFYGKFFKQRGFSVETEQEIFSHSRSIDLVVRCNTEQCSQLNDTVFAHFRELNAIELKGYNDALNVKDFNKIMMRAWGLGAIDFVKEAGQTPPSRLPNQRTLTIICVTRPRKILDELASIFQLKATKQAGVYHATGLLDVWLVHPTELTLCEANYPLLALARGEKLEQFIALCMRQGLTHYLELILYVGFVIDPETIWRKILEANKMKHVIHDDTWPFIDEFFREVPEAIGKLQTFQEVLLQKLNEGKREGKLEGKREGEKTGMQKAMQSNLIRLLTIKFDTIPEPILTIIQQTEDIKRLEHWLDQVIIVKVLDEIDFTVD